MYFKELIAKTSWLVVKSFFMLRSFFPKIPKYFREILIFRNTFGCGCFIVNEITWDTSLEDR